MNKIDLSHDHASNGRRLEIRKSSDRTPKGKIVQDISEKATFDNGRPFAVL